MTTHPSTATTTGTPTTLAEPTAHHLHTERCWWDVRRAGWSCSAPEPGPAPETETEPERPLVDVRDMLVVHTAMLRELRLAPAAVRSTTPGDRRRARAVAGHVRLVTDLLHHHHEGEDALLWPVLRERTSAEAAALIDEVEEQHAGLDLELATVERLRGAWASSPTAFAGAELAHHLDHLHVLLRDHLELEERALLPIAAAVLTEAEWHAVGEAGAAAVPRTALPLVFGMFAYEGDPEVVSSMLASAPRLARAVLPVVATRAYARRARRVHETARP